MATLKYIRNTVPEVLIFGSNLRAARLAKGLTLREMATELDMSYGWRGQASLSIVYMAKLAQYVGRTIIELLIEQPNHDVTDDGEEAAPRPQRSC